MWSHSRIARRLAGLGTASLLLAPLSVALVAPAGAADGPVAPPMTQAEPQLEVTTGESPPARQASKAEVQFVRRLDFETVAKNSTPLEPPKLRPLPAGRAPINGTDGPAVLVQGTSAGGTSASALTAASSVTGALWPGGATSNPNRQVGKLYFDTDPTAGVRWNHCTGTAINSENKSTVLTAGHCVYDFANRRWYTNLVFRPGYENGARLGAWPVRIQSTTSNYHKYGAGADDMAVVVVERDSAGVPLVNRVGGHGIAFNQPVRMTRSAFGYPMTDTRWPGWTSSGEDLYYCQGADTYYSSGSFAGQMWLSCRMTGGASGGPWLSNVASSWMGTAISVNSNKGGIGTAWAGSMFGPYMGAQESAVFQTYRAS